MSNTPEMKGTIYTSLESNIQRYKNEFGQIPEERRKVVEEPRAICGN